MPKYFAIPAGAAASAGGPTIQEVSVAGPTIITNERDVIVLVNTSAVLVALTFSATPTVGDRVMIVDVTGESHMRRVVITRGGAQLINNATTIVLDIPSGRFTFFFDGTNWLADRPLNWDVTRRVNIDEHFAATPTRAGTLVTPNFSADSGSGGNINSSPSIAGRPGIVSLDTNTSATGRAGLATYGMTAGVGMFLNGGANFADAMARLAILSTAAQEYKIVIGYGDVAFDDNPSPAAYFQYDRASLGANWQCRTEDGASTITDSGVAVVASATDFQRFRVAVNAAGNSVNFLIDEVIVATHTTTIPPSVLTVMTSIFKTAGTTARFMFIDRIQYHKLVA